MVVKKSNIHEKLEVARKELLDLGMRNPLLNYRTLKARGLEIVRESPTEVYRMLVLDKKKMTFKESLMANKGEDEGLITSMVEVPVDEEHLDTLEANYEDSKLQTNYTEKQLESRLLNTYYLARTYIEEQGVNILYMALGMLHWHESDNSEETRRAPLLLIPIQLERVSARERFKVMYSEDEIGHNMSLVAKMKSEFGIDVPSLSEEDELDINQYFDDVKKMIAGQKNWSVDSDSIVLGFFSFGKFLMYRDLDVSNWPEDSRPEEHSIIHALLQDGFKEESSHIGENDHIDQHINLSDANHIMDADSSQMMAILDANQGRNMVIQGPPGTGKSQTITNLIAEAIGAGKKVLFVSEKMAALEVVKRRLDAVGLGVACLELHSHKTNKKILLNELSKTLDLGKPTYNDDGNVELLDGLRDRLNEYCEAVNKEVNETGVSPYRALGELAYFQITYQSITFPKITVNSMEDWTAKEYKKKEACIEEIQNTIRSMGVPIKHAFWGSRLNVVLPADIDAVRQEATEAAVQTKELDQMNQKLIQETNYPLVKDRSDTLMFIAALKRAMEAPILTDVDVSSDQWLKEQDSLKELVELGHKYKKIHDQYDTVLLPEAWDQDLLETRSFFVQYQDRWWRFFSGDFRKAKNKVLGLCKNPKEVTDILIIVDSIMEARRHRESINSHEWLAKELFPKDWAGVDSKWERMSLLISWIILLHEDIKEEKLPIWILDYLNQSSDPKHLQDMVSKLESQMKEANRSIERLKELLQFDGSIRFENKKGLEEQDYSMLLDLFSQWSARSADLHEIASYNNLSDVCAEEKLQPFVDLTNYWEPAGKHLFNCFRWNWYQVIAEEAFHDRKALTNFDGSRHEHAVNKFIELDHLVTQLNRVKLAGEHWRMLPQYEAGGQLGVLRREFEKKSRHLPIRQLMLKAGNAIQAIKPIFMMGPMSISTYIQPGSLEFDLVIFDEASQVKPVDAFGAIIRAKQAIVVGDSKQMPPTNFFDSISKEEDGDADENYASDMESILGLFVGQNAPQRMLRWHYRSRHESLIAVSNHEFYDDKLVVFPSPDADRNHSGLIYNFLPDTHYDRGRTKTNKLEAKAVAEAVMERAKRSPNLTIGVAAFSMSQMQAILDEMEMLRRAHPEYESFFSAHPHEPFFVKNLENVQGDERDVILISIGYGKTAEGYLSMSFGPLNREGGERRLNVLITRARIRCEVFTNLRSDDIDLNRSNANGVKALKTFLKYAEHGILDIPLETAKDFDSPFEETVYKALTDEGYVVKPQIGSAGFFIDLAVVDPDSPGRFLLGIECDGATYHSARSARDRDRLRQEVLEGLGWKIHRIWSTDWFRHPERELKKVIESIEKAKVHTKAQKIEENQNNSQSNPEITRDDSIEKEPVLGVVKYQVAELEIEVAGNEFYLLPASIIAAWVYQVVSIESPVHVTEVMKRICDAAGIKRVGRRIQEAIESSFHILENVHRRGDFLWLDDMKIPIVRDRADFKSNKTTEIISLEETEAAVLEVVRVSFGMEPTKVAQSVYQTLGFSRVTEDMKTSLSELLESMIHKEKLILRNGLLITNLK